MATSCTAQTPESFDFTWNKQQSLSRMCVSGKLYKCEMQIKLENRSQ